jgi:heme exporter protein A
MPAQPPLLAANDLTAERGGRALFSGVSVALSAGEIIMLRGANGTGKTTLLRVLAGLSEPEAGRVLRPEPMLFWGHAAAVKDELTPEENLRLLCANYSISAAQFPPILERCGLGARRHVQARRLSAGQRRRIGLARLLLATEQVWLLDEPTTALDTAGQGILADALNGLLGRGGAALVATHSDLVGLKIAPQVLNL